MTRNEEKGQPLEERENEQDESGSFTSKIWFRDAIEGEREKREEKGCREER